MLHKAKTLTDYRLDSLDGEIGSVREFYFDDRHWTIRYLVADTGNWLTGRQVLISPYALAGVSAEERHIAVDLTRQQIKDSPSLESDQPVSRQFEDDYYGYYGWPAYWGGAHAWGCSPSMVRERAQWKESKPREKAWDPNLRSTYDVGGHHVQATDGTIGHVEDFIIDDETWAIRYLIVDTQNWWPGKKVLISPRWIERVSWGESKVFVNVSREAIRHAPECTDAALITREYEGRLHRHHQREAYWVEEPVAK